jgi:MFS family permease
MTVDLPAPAVTAGAVPEVCARHGEPAVRRRKTVFRSHTPPWVYILLLFGVLPFAIVAGALQKRVKAPNWPFCSACGRRRIRRLLMGIGLVVLAVAGVVAATELMRPKGSSGGPVLLVFVLLVLAGLAVASTASGTSIASGYASKDGNTVHVRHAHQRFAEQVAALFPGPVPQFHQPYPPAASPWK